MRNIVVLTITLLLVTVMVIGISSDAVSRSEVKNHQIGRQWHDASYTEYSRNLEVLFDAIARKNETHFIPAIEEFVTMWRPSSNHRAVAIGALYRLNVPDATEKFHKLLADEVLFDTQLWPSQCREKSIALRLMHELGIELDDSVTDVILSDTLKTVELGYPRVGLPMLGWACELGYEIPKADADYIQNELSRNFRGVSGKDLRRCGIQLNWSDVFESRFQIEEPTLRRWESVCEVMLETVDEKAMKEYIKLGELDDNLPYVVQTCLKIAQATTGDKHKINELADNMQFTYFHYSLPVADRLPDKVFNSMIEFARETDHQLDYKFYDALIKRGKPKEVKEFLDAQADHVRNRFLETEDEWREAREIFLLFPLIEIDGERYMNLLWDLLEENPDSLMIASHMLNLRWHYDWDWPNEKVQKWVADNPEKFAQIIDIVLSNYRVSQANLDRDKETGLELNPIDYHYKRWAFQAMMYLPKDVFMKHFSSIDEEVITDNAHLTASYFGVDWPQKPLTELEIGYTH